MLAPDAHFLLGQSLSRLGKNAEAADAWAKATLLAPPAELLRRYPETTAVAEKHPASAAPPDALG